MKKVLFFLSLALMSTSVKAVGPVSSSHLPPVIIFDPNDESIMVGKLRQDGFKITTQGSFQNASTYILQRVDDDQIVSIALTFLDKKLQGKVVSVLPL